MCRNKNRNVHFVNTCDDYFQDVNDYDDCYEMCNVEESMNSLNIYSIGVNKPTEYWSVILSTPYEQGKGAVRMKIDTQAECNILSKQSFDRMAPHRSLSLSKSQVIIRSHLLEKTTFTVIHKSKMYDIDCEVVDGDVPNLLGGESSTKLGLIQKVNEISTYVQGKYLHDRSSQHRLPPGPEIPTVQSPPHESTQVRPPSIDKSNKCTKTQTQSDSEFLARVPNINKVPQSIREILLQYKDRFPTDRVGKIPGKCTLSIDPDYKDGPVSQAARPIPVAMRDRTKVQLDFFRVTRDNFESTIWYTDTVV
ncbi:uncharacterized protein LOC143257120 [Tachypleus tridentatus]|uniref:uncharacterized protein LOC143257120 n=1 Tax=Tachypleus tridentatus TaxID=6853 RepID=UPI003FCF1AEA